MSIRAFDITCPVVDERSLSGNVEVTHDHPRFPRGVTCTPSPRHLSDAHTRLHLVTRRSPLPLRRRVETLARYFRREFGYDFVNYVASERDPDCEAWLWTSEAGGRVYATGHAVFWRIAFKNRPGKDWELGSAWQHPYLRGHGRLTAIWPWWEKSYGPFWVSHPWSSAMRSFMSRHADHEFPDGTTAEKPLAAYRSREDRP